MVGQGWQASVGMGGGQPPKQVSPSELAASKHRDIQEGCCKNGEKNDLETCAFSKDFIFF